MSVDFKTFISLAPAVSKAGLPVILRGRHGVGKSQVVYQIAKNMELPVVERRASQMTEGDLVGLPSRWRSHLLQSARLVQASLRTASGSLP